MGSAVSCGSEPGTYCFSASSAELKTSLSSARASATSLECVEDGSSGTLPGPTAAFGSFRSQPKARGFLSLCSNKEEAAQARRLVIGGFHGPDDVKEIAWSVVRRSRMVL